jgi:hypothetical protein
MQPTFSKTSTHALCSERRAAHGKNRVPPLDRRFNTAEPTYCQLILPARASVIDSAGRKGLGSDASSPLGPDPCA